MSKKPVLILIHGMGKHTAASFKEEVLLGANNALGRYDGFKNIKFQDQVKIVSIEYDQFFEEYRKGLAENATGIQAALKKLPGIDIPSVMEKIIGFEAELEEDKFANTHILDVVLYLSLIGQQVRAHVMNELMKEMTKHDGNVPIHILSHSLGTAVIHDTLNQLYTNDASPSNDQLTTQRHKIKSLWTFANVSRLVGSVSGMPGAYDSLVKPGDYGCVGMFYNIFNTLDPFTFKAFKRFDPKVEYNWVHPKVFQYYYKKIRTNKVSRANTHSIIGYLEDPLVCHSFFTTFFDFFPTEEATKKGDEAFKHMAGEYDKIADFSKKIENASDFADFLKMIKAYTDFLKALGEDL